MLVTGLALLHCSADDSPTLGTSSQPLMTVHAPVVASVSVLTHHNSNARTGVNTAESVLGPGNVNDANFGELWSLPVDGQIAAQPLYVGNYTGTGRAAMNVLIVATLNNTVYAFNADSAGQPLWSTHIDAPYAGGGSIVNNKPTGHNASVVGILSTPVIDPTVALSGKAPGVIYYVEMFQPTTGAEDFILKEISLDDGSVVQSSSPFSTITDLTSKGFNTQTQLNRAALLLSQGNVYVSFGSRYENGGTPAWSGYMARFDASTLSYLNSYRTTPSTLSGGGIWQGGSGPAADSSGNVYFVTGNGDYPFGSDCRTTTGSAYAITATNTDNCTDPISTGPGAMPTQDEDSIVKLTSSLTKVGSYAPCETFADGRPGRNFQEMEACDSDFGSSGPILFTQGTSSRLIAGGKSGQIFTVDPTAMSGSQCPPSPPNPNPNLDFASPLVQAPFQATINTSLLMGKAPHAAPYGISDSNTQCYDKSYSYGPHIHGSPVFLSSTSGDYLFVWGERDQPRKWSVAGGLVTGAPTLGTLYSSPYVDSAPPDGMPGGALSISMNGSDLTSAILWALIPSKGGCGFNTECDVSNTQSGAQEGIVNGDLVALRASDMSLLWSTRNYHEVPATAGSPGDRSVGVGQSRMIRDYTKFVPPTIANGKVYVSTSAFAVKVYGSRTLGVTTGTKTNFNWTQCTDPNDLHVGDFDGDGVQDVICHHTSGSYAGEVAIEYGNNNFVAMPRSTTGLLVANFCYVTATTPSPTLYVGDFDGDGRADLLCHDFSTGYAGSGTDTILFSNGTVSNPFTAALWTSTYAWCEGPNDELVIGDYNGDGRSDLLCHDKVSPTFPIQIKTAQQSSTYFSVSAPDNWTTTSSNWCYDTGTAYGRTWYDHLLAADIDGDGMDDLICHNPFNGYKYVSYSKANRVAADGYPTPNFWTTTCHDACGGSGFYVSTDWSYNLTWCYGFNTTSGYEHYQFGMADINGDGAADMWCHNRDSASTDYGKTYVMYGHPRKRGSGCGASSPYNCTSGTSDWTSPTASCYGNIAGTPPTYVVGDFDGDNRADLMCHDNSGASCLSGATNCLWYYPF